MANTAVSVPATVAANAKLVDPGVKEVLADNYSMLDEKLMKLFKPVEMRTVAEEFAGYSGLGDVPMVSEAEEFGEDAIMHTYDTTLTAYKYGQNMPISWELLEDDLNNVVGKAKQASKALTRKAEKLGSDVLNNGFSTSYTSYGDGLPLFSVAHTRADGGSNQSNASASGITLTEANLETGIVAMREQLDDRGELVNIVPNTLVVPPALEKEALIICNSRDRSDTANNDANVYNMSEYTGGRLKVVVWDYLGAAAGGSDTAWFLLSEGDHQLNWGWRHKPSVKRLDESVGAKNQVYYWQYYFRAAYGWRDWRGVWGSQGDGQVYAS
jgi:phage major head subunit gpT-like protein